MPTLLTCGLIHPSRGYSLSIHLPHGRPLWPGGLCSLTACFTSRVGRKLVIGLKLSTPPFCARFCLFCFCFFFSPRIGLCSLGSFTHIKLALNSQRLACLCLPTAGIRCEPSYLGVPGSYIGKVVCVRTIVPTGAGEESRATVHTNGLRDVSTGSALDKYSLTVLDLPEASASPLQFTEPEAVPGEIGSLPRLCIFQGDPGTSCRSFCPVQPSHKHLPSFQWVRP